jgi:subtilisin family serine protease
VKYHLILKLHRALAEHPPIPYWIDFINDKTFTRETATPDIDGVMNDLALKYWLTKEHRFAGPSPSPEELKQGMERTYRLIFQQDYKLPADLIDRIRLLPSVEEARPLEVGEADIPPHISATASLERGRARDLIQLRFARALTRGIPQVRIAVLDTGVNLDHPELRGKIINRADFVDLEGLDTSGFVGDFKGYDEIPEDEVGHGTHVSGIVAGKGVQMDEGVAPGCGLMAVRVLATMKQGSRSVGAGIVDNINAGIKWAVDNGAHVINMSLGIKHVGGGLPHEDVIRYALSKNVAVVAASGNDGTAERYYPGALRGVFAVGAVDPLGNVAGFTSYGANIYVVAPGMNIYSSFAHGGYAFASGTSQASPFVAGAIGLLQSYAMERGKRLGNQDIAYILKNTSDRVDQRLRNIQAGYGLLNLADAFKLLAHSLN